MSYRERVDNLYQEMLDLSEVSIQAQKEDDVEAWIDARERMQALREEIDKAQTSWALSQKAWIEKCGAGR